MNITYHKKTCTVCR